MILKSLGSFPLRTSNVMIGIGAVHSGRASTEGRSSPPRSNDVAVVRQTVGRLGINYYRIDANANPSRFQSKFCISAHGAIAHPYVKPTALASVLSLGRIREFGKSCAPHLIGRGVWPIGPARWSNQSLS